MVADLIQAPGRVFFDKRTHAMLLCNFTRPFLGDLPIIRWIADAVSFAQSRLLREREMTANDRKLLKDTFARPRLF